MLRMKSVLGVGRGLVGRNKTGGDDNRQRDCYGADSSSHKICGVQIRGLDPARSPWSIFDHSCWCGDRRTDIRTMTSISIVAAIIDYDNDSPRRP